MVAGMAEGKLEQLEEGRVEGFKTPEKTAPKEKTTPDTASTSTTSSDSPASSVENEGLFTYTSFELQQDLERNDTEVGRRPTLGAESDPRAIVSRIIRDVKLCLMSAVPAPDKSLELTSIVTPSGLYQLNQKTNAFELILSKAQLLEIELDEWLKEAERLSENEQASLYPHLTLEQLNKVERLVRAHGGFSVTGYTCIEEFWLRLMMCGHFPPLPHHYAKRFLDYIHKPVVQDAVLATRMMAHSAIIYGFVDEISFAGKQDGLVAAYQFTEDNTLPLLVSLMGVGLLSFLFLRVYQDKEQALKIASRINLMLSTTIGFAENWENYGSLIFSENMFLYILIPIVIVGMVRGFYRHEKDTPHVLDITKFTLTKFLWYSVAYALTEGSLWSLGMASPLNCIFIFKDMNDPDNLKTLYDDLDFIRYSVSFLTLFAQLARHPALPMHYQVVGRYASNIITATGEAFLDNAALSFILGFAYGWIFGNNPSPSDVGQLTGYFAFQVLFAMVTFLVSFPITPELPEYKVIPTQDETVSSKISSALISELSEQIERKDADQNNAWPRWLKRVVGSKSPVDTVVITTASSPLCEIPKGPGL